MLVLLTADHEELSREAARILANAVNAKPTTTLGLATGSTMLGMYRELVRMHTEEALDFSQVTTFNLDEYLGLTAEHPQSFHRFMKENFFEHVNADEKKTHVPDGMFSGNYEEYCARYEKCIHEAGGIDLQILGIGRNGHIGFNEPTSSFGSRTRLKALTEETRDDNRRFFAAGETIPECAVTMGLGTILEAKRIVLLATGAAKAEMVAAAVEGPITASVTASCLQLHPDATFIVDEAAAAKMKQRAYYRRVMELTAKFTPHRLS
ncbi:MAG TPA: glucosamine-6-phosphate deaminase [Candidatus Acidoferrum sp.]|nr:glucosamine-6-phosphate deaminase [Candidatus Acidoferrum sp.]